MFRRIDQHQQLLYHNIALCGRFGQEDQLEGEVLRERNLQMGMGTFEGVIIFAKFKYNPS